MRRAGRRPSAAGPSPARRAPRCRGRRTRRAPLAGRRERHAPVAATRPAAGTRRPARRAVALRSSSAASAPSAAAAGRRIAVERASSASNTIVALGEGAGLVEADARRRGPGPRRRAAPARALAARQAHRRDGEGDAGQQHQALGHHADQRRRPCRSPRRASRCSRPCELAPRAAARPTGTIAQLMKRSSWLMPSISSERVQREPAGLVGELGGVGVGADPVAWNPPVPGDHEAARQHLVARRPCRRVGLAGEQRLVDLEPGRRARTTPSAGTWSPVRSSSRSSSTTSATAHVHRPPSRTTRARGALRTASRSRVRLARSSWTMPMAALATMTRPKSASCAAARRHHERRAARRGSR